MPLPLASLAVTAGQTYVVSVGTRGTVGAVVIANESPYSLQVSTGSGGLWIVAQTADLVPCDSMAFSGNLTITTDNYLSNASNAPSFLVYMTAYAPGEAIRGTYPAPLLRLANGGDTVAFLSNDTNPAGTLVVETRPVNKSSAYFALYNDGTATWQVLLDNGASLTVAQVISSTLSKLGQLIFPHGWGSGANPGVNGCTDNGAGQLTVAQLQTAQVPILITGNQETGACGIDYVAAAANAPGGYFVNFKTVMTNVPSSITLSQTSATNVAATYPRVDTITVYGFHVFWEAAAAGTVSWKGTYTTVGN